MFLTMKWSDRTAQGFSPGRICIKCALKAPQIRYTGAIRRGLASPRAGKTCQVARCISVARSKNTCSSANRGSRGRDPSLPTASRLHEHEPPQEGVRPSGVSVPNVAFVVRARKLPFKMIRACPPISRLADPGLEHLSAARLSLGLLWLSALRRLADSRMRD